MPDVVTDVLTRPHYDAGERLLRFVREQNVTDIVERNKALQSEQQRSDWGRHHSSVPNIVIEKWLNEEHARGNIELRFLGPGFDEFYARKMQDPDNRAWRVDNPSNPFHMGWKK